MKLIDTRLIHQAKSSQLALGLTIFLGFLDCLFTVIQAWFLSRDDAIVRLGVQSDTQPGYLYSEAVVLDLPAQSPIEALSFTLEPAPVALYGARRC